MASRPAAFGLTLRPPTHPPVVPRALVSTYLAHSESGPDSSRPRITPGDAAALRPEDIAGDVVTAPTSPLYLLQLGGRALRLVVRARAGTCARDAEIYSWRCPMLLLLICVGGGVGMLLCGF